MSSSFRLNSITSVFLLVWLRHQITHDGWQKWLSEICKLFPTYLQKLIRYIVISCYVQFPMSISRGICCLSRCKYPLCLIVLAHLLPRPEPAGLLRLVIRREHRQHDLPQHQNQPNRRHSPCLRRAPAATCGKGMLPILDPYRGVDWGWRLLYWIDVTSTT